MLDVQLLDINPAIQFTMETSDSQPPFLDVTINKEGKKIFMDICSEPTKLKRYVSINSNHPKHYLKISHFLMLAEFAWLLKKIFLKNYIGITRNTSTRAAQPKKKYKSRWKESFKNTPKRIKKCKATRKKKKVLPIISAFNPNNPKALPIIKQTLENLKS